MSSFLTTLYMSLSLRFVDIPNREEFVRNNRGINDNADLPREYLEGLYDRILARQIQARIRLRHEFVCRCW